MSGIPWRIGIPAEVITEYAGTRLKDFYLDPQVMLRSQELAFAHFRKEFHLLRNPSVMMTSYLTATTLGLEVNFPDDNEPQYDRRRVLSSLRDVDSLTAPSDPCAAGLVPRYLETHAYFRSKLGEGFDLNSGFYSVSFQGPVTTAVLLRGEKFYSDLYEDPSRVHRLLDIVTDNSIELARRLKHLRDAASQPVSSVGINDDYAGLMSPEHYEEFAMPYLSRLFAAFPSKQKTLHSETLHQGHLGFLQTLGVTCYDPGMDQYLTLDMLEDPPCFFYWNLHTVRDMLQGSPEIIRRLYIEAIEHGAPGVMTEICRRTPRENLRTFLEIARSCED